MLQGIIAALVLVLNNVGSVGTTDCDQHFLDVLRAHDITFISPEWAVWDAHEVCVNVESGVSAETVAQGVQQQSGMDGWHAGFFTGAAIGLYCPEWAK